MSTSVRPFFPLSAMVTGFVTVLIGFTSSAVLIFQAAEQAGATPAQVSSWIGALAVGMGLTTILLSWRYKVPVVTAWSTPGAALLVGSLSGVPMAEVMGAFVFCGALITLFGVTGWFERAMHRLPIALAAAMLAGVLLRFGMDVFVSLTTNFWLVMAMFAAYLVFKRWWPRYVILMVLAIGTAIAALTGALHLDTVQLAVSTPVWVTPAFNWQTLIGVGLPLFIVTMASQNIPGVAVMRAAGYHPPISPLITTTGVATLVLAPFGGFAINLAAITAAICMGPEADEDPAKRYVAAIFSGGFAVLLGVFGAIIGALFAAFPKALVLAVAGLALLGTIGNALSLAVKADDTREAALVTFLATASGISLFGIGSAFWGLVLGGLTLVALKKPAASA
ncbi:MAG: benzoate/H(+) symporter BenE family transporter [Denitromonas halophila]|nr:MAG: benzoate/H(+) symporter BenE family transporter [Denitromonas halophila]